MLKRTALLVGLAALTVVGASVAAPGKNAEQRIEKRVERITERLNLSPEQADTLATVMREQAAKQQALREETRTRIDSILNDEQRAQAAEMREQRKERRQSKRRGRHGAMGKDCPAASNASVIAPDAMAQKAYTL